MLPIFLVIVISFLFFIVILSVALAATSGDGLFISAALLSILLLGMGIASYHQYRTQTVPKTEYNRLEETCRESKTIIL